MAVWEQVRIHVGAHKTATTYIQETLDLNAPALAERGLTVKHHETMRLLNREVRMRLSEGIDDEMAVVAGHYLGRKAGDQPDLVFCEENLLHQRPWAMGPGRFYPLHAMGLATALSHVRHRRLTITFCVRSYEGFLPSLYVEGLRQNRRRDIRQYLASLDLNKQGWPKAVSNIRRQVGDADVLVWRYEDFAGHERSFLSALTGIDIDWQLPNGRVRVSPSGKAVAATEWLSSVFSTKNTSLILGLADRALPRWTGKFTPLSAPERAQLRAHYERHWEEIKVMPKVRVLSPAVLPA